MLLWLIVLLIILASSIMSEISIIFISSTYLAHNFRSTHGQELESYRL